MLKTKDMPVGREEAVRREEGVGGTAAPTAEAELASLRDELRRIAHDMKNSVHAWTLRMDLLARDLDPQSTHIQQLRRVVDRIDASVEMLRTLARGPNGAPATSNDLSQGSESKPEK